ncbi:MAG: SelT/SelW/SelH family protein [Caldilineaceae bacterium]|nr:SelT/SelW/SelH family protein [Caldilineaceae bacterium]MCB0144389.1 SelT/SelW/SelH family protein [Caldilineaceae bacterium]
MPITKERFEQGLTYEQYRRQMTRNEERFDANEQTVKLKQDDVDFFAHLPYRLNVVVLAEDWCGDVIANLPVLGALARASDKLNVRIFLRDQNLDIMDQYLKEGKHQSIPVFAFLDQDFHDLGHWIERPVHMSELQAEMRRELFATDPVFNGIAPDTSFGQMPEEARNRLAQAFGAFREENRNFSDQEVVRELRELVEHGKVQPHVVRSTNGVTKPAFRKPTPVTTQERVKVSITYCAACGYEPQTLELAGDLMRTFIYELSTIELIPWQDGAFDVTVNGDLVHSMYRDGGFPASETIIDAVKERLVN